MAGGGGSGGQEAVSFGPTPTAALEAGQIQQNASYNADQMAQQSTQAALASLQGAYNQAQLNYQPYQQSGVAALDQMNYLLGLSQYTPTAPTAPQTPEQYAASQVTPAAINQYIAANTVIGAGSGGGAIYSGAGAFDTNNVNESPTGTGVTGFYDTSSTNALNNIDNSGKIKKAVSSLLTSQATANDQADYAAQTAAYNTQLDNYNQDAALASQYQAKGPATQSDISNIVTNMPGFQFAQQQGLQAIQNSASASGQLGSGNLLESLTNYGQGLSQQYFQQYLNNLSGEAGLGANVAGQSASQAQTLGNATAGLIANQGTTDANSILSAGSAGSQGLLSANQTATAYNVGGGSSGGGLGGILSGAGSLASGLGSLF